ncbi:recombination regulator RecX [Alloiococcus sp. CFN-8]|uniref:recombination regulator RecX n=1 Tax=Alloiococcus sp. CFN-8 TaxID=3416081 RepID=UPI003CE8A82C
MEGIITKLEVQKKNKNRINIYIDDEYKFACDEEIVYRYKLTKGKKVDVKEIEDIAEEDNFIKGKNYAFRIIEKSYKTKSQVIDKLISRGYDEKIINKIMRLMEEYNLIDDKVYVKAYIKDNLSKQGKMKLLYNLKSKGIKEEIIQSELKNIDDNSLEEAAYNLAEKKYQQLIKRETDAFKITQKLSTFLLSRGYGYDMIKKVSRRLLEQQED